MYIAHNLNAYKKSNKKDSLILPPRTKNSYCSEIYPSSI